MCLWRSHIVLVFALLDQHVFAQGNTPLDDSVWQQHLDVSVAVARAGGRLKAKAKSEEVWSVYRGRCWLTL